MLRVARSALSPLDSGSSKAVQDALADGSEAAPPLNTQTLQVRPAETLISETPRRCTEGAAGCANLAVPMWPDLIYGSGVQGGSGFQLADIGLFSETCRRGDAHRPPIACRAANCLSSGGEDCGANAKSPQPH